MAPATETPTCRLFRNIYANSTDMIVRLWDYSFTVGADDTGHTFFDQGAPPFTVNPNDGAGANSEPPFCSFRPAVDGWDQTVSDIELYGLNVGRYAGAAALAAYAGAPFGANITNASLAAYWATALPAAPGPTAAPAPPPASASPASCAAFELPAWSAAPIVAGSLLVLALVAAVAALVARERRGTPIFAPLPGRGARAQELAAQSKLPQ